MLVRGEDNAATELIEEGVNGFVAASADADDLAAAVMRVRDRSPSLRDSTLGWFTHNAIRLSLERSLATLAGAYVSER